MSTVILCQLFQRLLKNIMSQFIRSAMICHNARTIESRDIVYDYIIHITFQRNKIFINLLYNMINFKESK